MQISFFKYQGTGNDFILIDNRHQTFPKNNTKLVAALCDRKFGIGADGLILLENHESLDFKMVYHNSDGNISTMCGNGGRCLVAFAAYLGLIKTKAVFEAVDGVHHAIISETIISLQMQDVSKIKVGEGYLFLNTGSPHHVTLVDSCSEVAVFDEGRTIRNTLYGAEGANVNFVEQLNEDTFKVRTYERGVEDETLSCGTGVTAVALAMFEMQKTKSQSVKIETPGGNLEVQFKKEGTTYHSIYLKGPALQVFKGTWG